jgi:hypothetical protein
MPGPITITDGGYCEKDSDEVLVYEFDYNALNLPVGVELVTFGTFVLAGETPMVLTKDNEALMTGNRKTQVRLSGGTVGRKYTVINRVTTNEVPSQVKEKRFSLRIKS